VPSLAMSHATLRITPRRSRYFRRRVSTLRTAWARPSGLRHQIPVMLRQTAHPISALSRACTELRPQSPEEKAVIKRATTRAPSDLSVTSILRIGRFEETVARSVGPAAGDASKAFGVLSFGE
jgi:hypothetical protein